MHSKTKLQDRVKKTFRPDIELLKLWGVELLFLLTLFAAAIFIIWIYYKTLVGLPYYEQLLSAMQNPELGGQAIIRSGVSVILRAVILLTLLSVFLWILLLSFYNTITRKIMHKKSWAIFWKFLIFNAITFISFLVLMILSLIMIKNVTALSYLWGLLIFAYLYALYYFYPIIDLEPWKKILKNSLRFMAKPYHLAAPILLFIILILSIYLLSFLGRQNISIIIIYLLSALLIALNKRYIYCIYE